MKACGRSISRLALIGLSCVVVGVAVWTRFRPVLLSLETIRASLVSETPIGSSMDVVRASAGKHGWIDPATSTVSYMRFAGTTAGIDVTALGGIVARDPFPYNTIVVATWEFDTNNLLANISVVRARH